MAHDHGPDPAWPLGIRHGRLTTRTRHHENTGRSRRQRPLVGRHSSS